MSNDTQPSVDISVPMPSHPSLPSTERIVVFINSDLNQSTGEGGADLEICTCGSGTNSLGLYLYSYNGSQWVAASPQPASLRASYNNGWSLDFLARDLGIGSTLQFQVKTFQRTGDASTDITDDFAPDQGFWTYNLSTTTVTPGCPPNCKTPPGHPVRRQTYITATGPVAGKNFAVSLDIVNSKTGQTYRGGVVSCRAHYGGDASVGVFQRVRQQLESLPLLVAHTVRRGRPDVHREDDGDIQVNSHQQSLLPQVVKETASVLVFPNGASRASPLQAGKQFVVNLSARLKNPDGSFQSINWHRSGSSATCTAHIVGGAPLSGTVKRFTTGVQCLWSIPYSARGQQIAFSITVKANGLTKTINFTGRPA